MIIPEKAMPNKAFEVIYQRIIDAGVDKDLFFDGKISCVSDFVEYMRNDNNYVNFVAEGDQVVGGGWLNSFRENTAMGHFFALPPIWGRATEVLCELPDHWFSLQVNGRNAIDVIIGEYPACHERILKFMLKLGAVYLGEIPEVMHGPNRVGSKLVYLTREGYHGR